MNVLATVSKSQDFDRIHEPVSIFLFFSAFVLIVLAMAIRMFGRSKKGFAKPLAFLVIALTLYPTTWFSFAAYVDYIPPELIDRKSTTPNQLQAIGLALVPAFVGIGILLSLRGREACNKGCKAN